MGGVDPVTGRVIDTHHPLQGRSVAGRVLALPSGRGSCSGSGTLFELLVNGHAPAALVFCADEPILTLGVVLAAELLGSASRWSGSTRPTSLPCAWRPGCRSTTGW